MDKRMERILAYANSSDLGTAWTASKLLDHMFELDSQPQAEPREFDEMGLDAQGRD